MSIPLLKPLLPSLDTLTPYLKKIDGARWYTNFGPLNQILIDRITEFHYKKFGRKAFAVTTSSCTIALELLIESLKLPSGSKILIPALTFIATASAIQRCGHYPIVGDVDENSWLLTPESIAKYDLSSIAAIIPVGTFGVPQEINEWSDWQEKNHIPVVIDAASCFGAQNTAKKIPIVFSMHATKSFSSAEGGLILTEDLELAESLKKMTNFGIGSKGKHQGTNSKLSEYHAAVGNACLDNFESDSQKRMRVYLQYFDTLKQQCGYLVSYQRAHGLFAPNIFPVVFKSHEERQAAEEMMASRSIETRRWYQPLIQNHPDLKAIEKIGPTPISDGLEMRMLGLPFYIDMSLEEQTSIAKTIKSSFQL